MSAATFAGRKCQPPVSSGAMDWWLEHGLDGIVGALVGGLVTALAVWLTLRHERRLVRENAAIETAARLFPVVLEYSTNWFPIPVVSRSDRSNGICTPSSGNCSRDAIALGPTSRELWSGSTRIF